jgi:polyketide synthase PksN
MQHGQIPPSLHFHRENPFLRLKKTPFYVNDSLADWPSRSRPKRAGISSFGLGGSNAHVILEEAPRPVEAARAPEDRLRHILTLSAKTKTALSHLANRFKDHLLKENNQRLTDICFTASAGRGHFNHRLAVVFETRAEVMNELERISNYGLEACSDNRSRSFYGKTKTTSQMLEKQSHFVAVFLKSLRKEKAVEQGRQSRDSIEPAPKTKAGDRLMFLLSEQGLTTPVEKADIDQLLTIPAMKTAIEQCERIVSPRLSHPLRHYIYAQFAENRLSEHESLRSVIDFSWQYAIARLWMSWGVNPDAVWGRGTGVYVAACINGLLTPGEIFRQLLDQRPAGYKSREVQVPMVNERGMELVETGCVGKAFWEERKGERNGELADLVKLIKTKGYNVFLEIGGGYGLWQDVRQTIKEEAEDVFLSLNLQKGTGVWESFLRTLAQLYIKGKDINWEGFYGAIRCRRVSLPTYPFDRARHWLSRKDAEDAMDEEALRKEDKERAHALLGSRVSENVWEVTLGEESGAVIRDHRVKGKTIVSGASFLAMAKMAGEASEDRRKVQWLGEITFAEPLEVCKNGDVCVRTVLEGDRGAEKKKWRVICLEHKTKTEKMHALGQLGYTGDAREGKRYPIEEIKSKCEGITAGEKVYEYFKEVGLEYGGWYQSMDRLWIGSDEVLGELTLPEEAGRETSRYSGFHPSILDGAFQTTIGLLKRLGDKDNLTGYVPFYLRRVNIFGDLSSCRYAYVRNIKQKQGQAKSLRVDVSLLARDGRELLTVDGLVVTRMGESAAEESQRAPGGALRHPDWFYRVVWRRKDLGNNVRPLQADGSWLVFLKKGGLGEALCKHLERYGQQVLRIYAEEGHAEKEPNTLTIDPSRYDHHMRVIKAWRRCGKQHSGVVHLWGAEGVGRKGSGYEEQTGFYSLFHLIKVLSAEELSPPSGIWLVSWNSQPFGSGPYQAEQSMAWGLVRAARQEQKSFSFYCIDIEKEREIEEVVGKELMGGRDEPEVVYRQGLRYVPRLERLGEEAFRRIGNEPGWRFQGVYLITGGAGGIGLELAKYLSQSVQGRLALVGRREGMTEEAEKAIEEMKSAGGEVMYYSADVGNLDQMREVVEEIKKRYGRLDGVVHAAGVVRDGLLRNKNEESVMEVLWPKVQGLRVLHEVTKTNDLDAIILFSSISGVLGNIGQGDYGAANAFMDTYGQELARLGEKVKVVDWSLWGHVGMGRQIDHRATGERIRPMDPEDALEALDWALRMRIDRVLIGDIEAESLFGLKEEGATGEAQVPETGDLKALPQAVLERKIGELFIGALVEKLGYEQEDIDEGMSFEELGFDSVFAVQVVRMYEEQAGISLDPTILFDYSTIRDFSRYLAEKHGRAFEEVFLKTEMEGVSDQKPDVIAVSERTEIADVDEWLGAEVEKKQRIEDIALIGMAGRFPGARNLEAFWDNLHNGVDSVTEMPLERREFQPALIRGGQPDEKIWGGFLEGIDEFSPTFFNLSGRLAEAMDPQHRLLLEATYEALENAGYAGQRIRGTKTGVFVGISAMDYYQYVVSRGSELSPYLGIGNAFSIAANRVSHFFDLRGPSLAIDTACSSSLVALHMACQSIRSGEVTMAIAGGVNITLSPVDFIVFRKAGMLSTIGRCKSFDQEADGYVRGEGVGVVLLKPLAEAIKDGDHIHAVVKGSAVIHDGHTSGLTVPNAKAQKKVLLSAWQDAGISPESLSYIEAHGTGTPLGDPIEVRGLKQAFREYTNRRGFCALGSVKTNIGHLEPAAGIAGVIKVVLCFNHREFVPILHYKKANQRIRFEDSPLYINDRLRPWRQDNGPRRAGVSSFGFGGMNAHVVLEEGPKVDHRERVWERPMEWIVLSAKSEGALRQRIRDLGKYLRRKAGKINLEDFCFTLAVGRDHFQHRLAISTRSLDELSQKINGSESAGLGLEDGIYGTNPTRRKPELAFYFTGEGFRQGKMGEKLYLRESVFREAMERCAQLFDPQMKLPFLSLVNAGEGYQAALDEKTAEEPVIFALGYSLAQLWMSWGVMPTVVMGQGVGEYAAACVAGMLGLEDAARLIAARTRKTPIKASEDGLITLKFSPPEIPFLTYLDGRLVEAPTVDIDYWLRREQESIPIGAITERLQDRGHKVVLKLGPAGISTEMDEATQSQQKSLWIISSLKRHLDDQASVLEALARLYVKGVNIDWEAYYSGSGRRRIPLPTYPFEKKRCWVAPEDSGGKEKKRFPSKHEGNPEEKR